MLELGHPEVGDRDEVPAGTESARSTLGLLQQAVHGFHVGIAAGVVHAFSNPFAVTAKALIVQSPDIGAQYFRDIAAVVGAGGPPDKAVLVSVMARYGLVPAPVRTASPTDARLSGSGAPQMSLGPPETSARLDNVRRFIAGLQTGRERPRRKAMRVSIKRAYEPPAESDGKRILIDRLWPRGLTKQQVAVDLWMKDVAPSTALRKWFGHDPDKWVELQRRYEAELAQGTAFAALRKEAAEGHVTLVYGAKDERHNHAVVLQRLLSGGT
jgi:uncharacterized protein YeaO (DUF488 family)